MFSDFNLVSVQEKGVVDSSLLSPERILDEFEDYKEFENFVLYEIPCGNGGGLAVYSCKNKEGEVVAIKINGDFDWFFKENMI